MFFDRADIFRDHGLLRIAAIIPFGRRKIRNKRNIGEHISYDITSTIQKNLSIYISQGDDEEKMQTL